MAEEEWPERSEMELWERQEGELMVYSLERLWLEELYGTRLSRLPWLFLPCF